MANKNSGEEEKGNCSGFSEDNGYCTLVTGDGEEFRVFKRLAIESKVLRAILVDEEEEGKIILSFPKSHETYFQT